MAANVCPACNAPIDPARAPVARVRGGKVVTFCSIACAEAPVQTATPADASAESPRDKTQRAVPGADAERAYERAASVAPRGNRKRRVILLSSALLVGGMAITVSNAVITAVSPSTPSDASAAASAVRHRVAPGSTPGEPGTAPAAPVPPTPLELYERAQSTLRALLTSPSPREQRIAAMALARLNDAAAIERLATLLEEETSELARIEVAYALARAGDIRGRKALARAIEDERRDIRLDAARALVQLGDEAGNQVLRYMMRLSTHRIGAAGVLARAGDEEGLEALREELGSSDISDERRMRAVVALGRAGDASVRDQLLAILEDGRYHVGAADALAALRDRAAVPALIRQLDLPALRVRAALGLRRLGEMPALDELAAALDTGTAAARVSAAEAILILAGPEQLAERD